MPALNRVTLAEQFRNLGLGARDHVIIHSSLKAVGIVDGGPDAIIDALLFVIGPHGNLMFPTFGYSQPLPVPYYDPKATPCRTGIIPETARKRRDAIRSMHPTHAVAVIGPAARRLTDGHLDCRAFGVGSPIDRLTDMGGKVLLLGVGHVANSTIHVAEEHAGIPKPQKDITAKVLTPDGRIIDHPLDSSPSRSLGFGKAEPILREADIITDGVVGKAPCQLMRGRAVIDRIAALLKDHPTTLQPDLKLS
jgi:aminoglycoside 3-N-acetyltransferase